MLLQFRLSVAEIEEGLDMHLNPEQRIKVKEFLRGSTKEFLKLAIKTLSVVKEKIL